MLPSVTGYQGFRSYGNHPAIMKKPGVVSEEHTYFRDALKNKGRQSSLDNYVRYDTAYNKEVSLHTKPKDYKPPNSEL